MISTDVRERLRTARPHARLRRGESDWYRFENRADGATALYIYDEIGYFGVTANDFVRDLRAVTASELEVHLNSPGGDVFDGLAIHSSLSQHPASVTVIVDGLAASAASFIAMAGDRVEIARNAQMMIHDAHGLVIGNAIDMAEMAEQLDKVSDNIADIYTQRAGGTVDQWRALMRAETWYTGEEAVTAGLADALTGGKSGESGTPSDRWDLSVFCYAGRDAAPAPPPSESDPEPDYASLADSLKEAFA